MQNRKAGTPNPYIVGADGYANYLGILSECAQQASAP